MGSSDAGSYSKPWLVECRAPATTREAKGAVLRLTKHAVTP